MRTAGGTAPSRVMAAWPALLHRQRELRGEMAIFASANVCDLKESVRRATGPAPDPSGAIPPESNQLAFLWRIVRGEREGRLGNEYKATAWLALVQFYAVQRVQAVISMDKTHLRSTGNGSVTLAHRHKTQSKGSGNRQKPLVPSEPFPDPGLLTTKALGLRQGWLSATGVMARGPRGKPLTGQEYNDLLRELWIKAGVDGQLAEHMTSHGLRRGGLQYYYELWGWGGLDRILRLGHWSSLSAARPYLPPL